MPTYDFACEECGTRFEVSMSITAYSDGQRPKCEKCGSERVVRTFTSVNVITSGGGAGASPPCATPSCGPGRFT